MGINAKFRAWIPQHLKERFKNSRLNYYRLFLYELRVKRGAPQYFGQTAEDAILAFYLPEKLGSYVDIGAGRPISNSNTYAFYKGGWTGICVDPISINFRMLKILRRRDLVLNILVGPIETKLNFWEFEPYGYSTVVEEIANKVKSYPEVKLMNFSQKNVVPLSKFAPQSSLKDATLLCIDVEGFDLAVLQSNNWSTYRPRVICVEEWESTIVNLPFSEIEKFLLDLNYIKKAWTGLSSVYVDKGYLESNSSQQ